MVRGDAEELRTVISNLLDNAVKYSGHDVRVTVVGGRAGAGHDLGARAGSRRRHSAQAAEADLQPLLPRADAAGSSRSRAPGSACTSCARSPARTAGASSRRARAKGAAPRSPLELPPRPARHEPRSWSSKTSSTSPKACASTSRPRATRRSSPRRRARAGLLLDEGRAVRRRHPRRDAARQGRLHRGLRAARRRPVHADPDAHRARTAPKTCCAGSRPAPTTTCPSRSSWRSCWRA